MKKSVLVSDWGNAFFFTAAVLIGKKCVYVCVGEGGGGVQNKSGVDSCHAPFFADYERRHCEHFISTVVFVLHAFFYKQRIFFAEPGCCLFLS